jgi:predicted TIM-barrel fold metal-dependent hydrolase
MIVDFRFSAPTEKGLGSILNGGDRMAGYRSVYTSEMVEQAKLMTPDELLPFLDQQGIDIAMMFTANSRAINSSYPQEQLAEYMAQHPDRLIGQAGIDPRVGPTQAVADVDHAIKELGFKAISLGPWTHRMKTDDSAYYPIYARCQELGVPVVLHCSVSFDRQALLDWEHPRRIDEIASTFPDLKIVATHAGWPWVNELVAVAWRHPTVYIEISAIRPRHLATPGSGYETLLQFGNTLLKNRILWASGWPSVMPDKSLADVRALPLKDDVIERWLGGNAQELLGL